MKVNNVKETKVTSLADRYSVGYKAISVALSVVLLGFGWPAVSPSEVYAESAEAQASAAENAQAKTEDAPANSDATGASNNDASSTKVQATTSDSLVRRRQAPQRPIILHKLKRHRALPRPNRSPRLRLLRLVPSSLRVTTLRCN